MNGGAGQQSHFSGLRRWLFAMRNDDNNLNVGTTALKQIELIYFSGKVDVRYIISECVNKEELKLTYVGMGYGKRFILNDPKKWLLYKQ